ncbi:aminodeoxychorismate/anthranilate synthase component II [uncultured Ilyobacter sp.]|uniref:anthranilate synthase component II n=1 Tax=uncultured Ilyobacter sp. TaxID=544433 RepID=UPI0029F530B9|nr:aminodeoxychorismate/anthranilate synthase component II [uncultured Ilyobacter sp.]
MILLIDNYDSFTFNLVQALGELRPDEKIEVQRNDCISLDEIAALQPSRLIISPGPCTPNEAGISVAAVTRFGSQIPLLGVCLGHQSIGQAFGGRVIRAKRLLHGKTSMIQHNDRDLFAGLPNPFEATRYHSLIVEAETLPAELEVTATAVDDAQEIMGLRHREHPIFGVQFHPESFLTQHGLKLLENFLSIG